MKKFKKPLTINIAQDSAHQHSSPKNMSFKQSKQRPLLMYNEHTIASSVNNQDEQIEQVQLQGCTEFNQFHGKNDFQTKNQQQQERKEPFNGKVQKYKKFNVIQFQEFYVEGEKSIITKQTEINNSIRSNQSEKQDVNRPHKKQFSIEIPNNQQPQEKQQISVKFAFDIKNENRALKQSLIKQPPGPSNKAKISKNSNRHFVFPTNDQQNLVQTSSKRQKNNQVPGKFVSEQEHLKKVKEINIQWNSKIQDINKNFQKERQQFYKQKSNLEKDLMIKEGQIQMLQKLITNRYSPKQGNYPTSVYSNPQYLPSERNDSYKFSIAEKAKNTLHLSEEKLTSLETILLQKDLKINSLLQKINELNLHIDKKNNEIEEVKISLMKSQKLNESLKNQIYLYEKKQESQKLTKQFYKVKQSLVQVQQASKTPKGYQKSKWQQDIGKQKEQQSSIQKKQYPLRGIDDLHKRLESLKMNRIELQSRGKIKSQIGYSQTSKNKTKGTFDFKGKFYDRDRDYINHSRMY